MNANIAVDKRRIARCHTGCRINGLLPTGGTRTTVPHPVDRRHLRRCVGERGREGGCGESGSRGSIRGGTRNSSRYIPGGMARAQCESAPRVSRTNPRRGFKCRARTLCAGKRGGRDRRSPGEIQAVKKTPIPGGQRSIAITRSRRIRIYTLSRIHVDPAGSRGYGSQPFEYLIDFSRCLVKWSGYLRISHEGTTRTRETGIKAIRRYPKWAHVRRGNVRVSREPGELEAITVISYSDTKG